LKTREYEADSEERRLRAGRVAYTAPVKRRNGVYGEGTHTTFANISDGSSNTFFAGEAISY
jgi:hypothetical protein